MIVLCPFHSDELPTAVYDWSGIGVVLPRVLRDAWTGTSSFGSVRGPTESAFRLIERAEVPARLQYEAVANDKDGDVCRGSQKQGLLCNGNRGRHYAAMRYVARLWVRVVGAGCDSCLVKDGSLVVVMFGKGND